MTLIELLTLWAFAIPLALPAVEGWKQSGLFGAFVGLLTGSVLGPVGFAGMWRVGRWLADHPHVHSANFGRWLVVSWLLLFGVATWIFGLSFLGMYLVTTLFHK